MEWEEYERSQERPEACPVCGGPNADDSGNPICLIAPDFCSIKCNDEYQSLQTEVAEIQYRAYQELKDLVVPPWERDGN